LLFFLLLVIFVNYFFNVEGSLFVAFLLFVIFINYFLLLRMARGIILLYLVIVQGEGVHLDLFIFNFFYSWGKKGVQVNVFFFPPSFDMWKEEGKGVSFFFSKPFFHCLGFRVEGAHLNANWLVHTIFGINLMVCNAIRFVTRCPPTINKKHQ
jgi:hypothetical protein